MIFHTPSNGTLNVIQKNYLYDSRIVFDISGKVLLNEKLNSANQKFKLSDFKGISLIKLNASKKLKILDC